MRRPMLGWLAGVAVLALAPATSANAQGIGAGVGADPFSFYYGYYLPHQAAIAAQPRVSDPINQVVANRQYAAQTDRSSLYDPISPYGDEESDPLRPYSPQGGRGAGRAAGAPSFTYGGNNSNTRGNGPAMYYSRTARYFPSLRTGRGPNSNVGVSRRGGGGGGMPSMPSMPSMGPR